MVNAQKTRCSCKFHSQKSYCYQGLTSIDHKIWSWPQKLWCIVLRKLIRQKMLILQFPYMKIVCLAFFWRQQVLLKLAPKFFWVFSTLNLIFISSERFSKKFCMLSLIFCVYILVLDTLILELFFRFFLNNFFQKRKKRSFLLYGMFRYTLIKIW